MAASTKLGRGFSGGLGAALMSVGSISVACVSDSSPSDDGPAGSGESGISSTNGSSGDSGSGSNATSVSTTGATSADATGNSGADGPKYDVGVGEETGGTGTDTEYDGPGSCRQSEEYGAAGGYPAFDDPAYAAFLDKQVLFMTSYAYQGNDFELRAIDISGDPPPPNINYAAPMYMHPSWTSATFGGGVFGLTLDSYGNIYLAASRVYGSTTTPGTIYKVDKNTAAVSVFATLPNAGPAFGNINYDCNSETIRVVSHEDCRIYQLDMNGDVVSTFSHGLGDVTMGEANDPGEPDGQFCPLGQRMWAVQSHYGRIYYSVWWEDSGRSNANQANEIWSVAFDEAGIPDPATDQLEATMPALQGSYSNPVADLSFAATGWMLVSERTMYGDSSTSAHQSLTYELQQVDSTWDNLGSTYMVGGPEILTNAAGGVDHDFAAGGYVWMTGDALDFYSPNVVYGVQGTPYGGGGVDISTIIDHDGEITQQDKTVQGDCEIPIPGDVAPPPPPPEG
jgi:hypothetical protein